MFKGQPREHLFLQFPVLCISSGTAIYTEAPIRLPMHQGIKNFRWSTMRMRRKVPEIDIFKVFSFTIVDLEILCSPPGQDLLSLSCWSTAMQMEVGQWEAPGWCSSASRSTAVQGRWIFLGVAVSYEPASSKLLNLSWRAISHWIFYIVCKILSWGVLLFVSLFYRNPATHHLPNSLV